MSEVDSDLDEHLQNLIERSPLNWTYAILWRCSSPRSLLSFHRGYCRTTGKPRHLRILGSRITAAESLSDAEWFFRISAAQSFRVDEDLPGHALWGSSPVWVSAGDSEGPRWERAAWGKQFGIRTFLCVPLKERDVLELASTQIVASPLKERDVLELASPQIEASPFHVIKVMADFIYPIGLPRLSPIEPHLLKQFRNDKKLHERAVNDMQNSWNDNLSKQSRGKEKISDSKCSWPLLTEMSDRTFSYSHDYSGPS
ncbi:transcription factor MYC2 [Cajanus cajan]|uniref:transcription factor MYC2 n=1 Tax=Cajanus cajan TaxID=3821 RepID=UPI00098D7C2D|nr:transcription factor MYC2 [Cajanus cajan]